MRRRSAIHPRAVRPGRDRVFRSRKLERAPGPWLEAIFTAVLLVIVLAGILGLQWSRTLQSLSSETGLYLLPTIIFFEFYFLTNDLLALLCEKYELDFGR